MTDHIFLDDMDHREVIAQAILSSSLYDFTDDMLEAAHLAARITEIADDANNWHVVFGGRNVCDHHIEPVLRDLADSGGNNSHPESRGIGIAFGELMLRIDGEDAREMVLDLAEGIVPQVCVRSATDAVLDALRGRTL